MNWLLKIGLNPVLRTRALLWVMVFFVFISRIFTVNGHLINAESVNLALALDHYDITAFRPHPPGFPVFVFFAKIFYSLGASPALALILPGILSAALAIFPLYYLTRRIYGIHAAVLALLLYAFNPSVWIASLKPLHFSIMLFPFLFSLRMILRNLLLPPYLRKRTMFMALYAGTTSLGLLLGVTLSSFFFIISLFAVSIYGVIKLKRKRVLLEMGNGLVAGLCLWAIPFFFVVSIADFINYKASVLPYMYVDPPYSSALVLLARLKLFIWNIFAYGFLKDLHDLSLWGFLPILIILVALVLAIINLGFRFRNYYLPIFLVPYSLFILFFQNLFEPSTMLLLVLTLIIFISGGLSVLEKRSKLLFYGLSAILVLFCVAFSIQRSGAFKKAVPHEKAFSNYINTHVPSDNTILFCGSSIRMLSYSRSDIKAYGIQSMDALNKPFFKKQTKGKTIYVTSEVQGAGREPDRFQVVATFQSSRYLFGSKNRIILYRIRNSKS